MKIRAKNLRRRFGLITTLFAWSPCSPWRERCCRRATSNHPAAPAFAKHRPTCSKTERPESTQAPRQTSTSMIRVVSCQIQNAFEMSTIRRGGVTCYMREFQALSEFWLTTGSPQTFKDLIDDLNSFTDIPFCVCPRNMEATIRQSINTFREQAQKGF